LKFIDEGNWRNDYPDEDEQWSDSSQDRKYYEDYGFDSGELTSKALVVKRINDRGLLGGLGASSLRLTPTKSFSLVTFKIQFFPSMSAILLLMFLKYISKEKVMI